MASPSKSKKSIGSLFKRNKKPLTTAASVEEQQTKDSASRDGPRSKSLDDIYEVKIEQDEEGRQEGDWHEISLVKSTCPVVMCILPSIAKDFVASALLAIGAYPLIPEGRSISICKDTSHFV